MWSDKLDVPKTIQNDDKFNEQQDNHLHAYNNPKPPKDHIQLKSILIYKETGCITCLAQYMHF